MFCNVLTVQYRSPYLTNQCSFNHFNLQSANMSSRIDVLPCLKTVPLKIFTIFFKTKKSYSLLLSSAWNFIVIFKQNQVYHQLSSISFPSSFDAQIWNAWARLMNVVSVISVSSVLLGWWEATRKESSKIERETWFVYQLLCGIQIAKFIRVAKWSYTFT